MIESSNIVDYGAFASLFKMRNGEYPPPFLREVRKHVSLHVQGEVPNYPQAYVYLREGAILEEEWKSVVYHVPRVSQREVFEDFTTLEREYRPVEVPYFGTRRRDYLDIDFVGRDENARGRATVRLRVIGDGRVSRVEFRHRREYTQARRSLR